jgi:hypothetical protein
MGLFQIHEKHNISRDINNLETGHGTLHEGKYYTLCYEPVHDPHTFKCLGVKLTMHPNPDAMNINHNFPNSPILVRFKPGVIFERGAFITRLESATKLCKKRMKDIDTLIDANIEKKARAIRDAKVWELTDVRDREKATVEYVNKINGCHMRVDATMKKIVPEAKPGISRVLDMKIISKPSNGWSPPVIPADYSISDCPLSGHAGIHGINPKDVK